MASGEEQQGVEALVQDAHQGAIDSRRRGLELIGVAQEKAYAWHGRG